MFTNEVITELEDTMETHEYSRLCRKNAAGVLFPTTLCVVLLMGLLIMAGLAQGSFAWKASGVPLANAIAITLIPILGGVVALFVFQPIASHYETKAIMASNVSGLLYATAIASSFIVALLVGFPVLFLWSEYLGMPFRGLCQALLLLHWYHFVLAGVVSLIYSYNVILVWARRSINVSKSASVVLHAH